MHNGANRPLQELSLVGKNCRLLVVNSLSPASVYGVVGILRALPGPVTEATCSRKA